MGVTTHSKNPELARAFIEWFYSEDWYPGYIAYISSASSMSNFPKDKDPVLAEADAAQPDGEMVMYDGGGDDFTAIQNEIAFTFSNFGLASTMAVAIMVLIIVIYVIQNKIIHGVILKEDK